MLDPTRTHDPFSICIEIGWPLICATGLLACPPFAGRTIAICVLLGVFPAIVGWHAFNRLPQSAGRFIILRQTGIEVIVGILLLPFALVGCVVGGLVNSIFEGLFGP